MALNVIICLYEVIIFDHKGYMGLLVLAWRIDSRYNISHLKI